MIKYAKFLDETIGKVQVGLGTNVETYKKLGMIEMDIQQSDIDGDWYLAEKCPMKSDEQKAQEEKERILALSMTRSDFFDGTIMAWGMGQEELLIMIQNLLLTLNIENTKKLIAINNFKNALNFYRKHELFNLLVNKPIQISDSKQLIITNEHLDKFFDEVAKGNKETAWQYLPQPIPPQIETSYDDI